MTRHTDAQRRVRVLIFVVCAIAAVIVIASGIVAWQTARSDARIEDSRSG